ncbi:hypothetical protein CBOM_06373 [Ceraceosorus bombacis]|uniref:Uncharacterized protein n=1 Tax=Ceraceosorus bombacis TaxID=401625 RepID=A0A0N7LAF3_9BASI|nr:hypothetical protein CBOM_06373 [Ceraceosorus bombacis]
MATQAMEKTLYHAQVSLINAYALLAIEAYNFILQTPADIEIWKLQIAIWKGQRPGPKLNLSWMFYQAVRWSILLNVPAALLVSGRPASCSATLKADWAILTLAETASALLFAFRTMAIWRGALWVKICMGFGVCCVLGVWVSIIPFLGATNLPAAPSYGAGWCAGLVAPSWISAAYFTSAAFDLAVVTLTFYTYSRSRMDLLAGRRRSSTTGTAPATSTPLLLFYRDAGGFFALSFAAHLINGIWQLTLQDPVLITLFQPYATAVVLGAAPQVYINLRLHGTTRQAPAPSSSYKEGASGTGTGGPSSGGAGNSAAAVRRQRHQNALRADPFDPNGDPNEMYHNADGTGMLPLSAGGAQSTSFQKRGGANVGLASPTGWQRTPESMTSPMFAAAATPYQIQSGDYKSPRLDDERESLSSAINFAGFNSSVGTAPLHPEPPSPTSVPAESNGIPLRLKGSLDAHDARMDPLSQRAVFDQRSQHAPMGSSTPLHADFEIVNERQPQVPRSSDLGIGITTHIQQFRD